MYSLPSHLVVKHLPVHRTLLGSRKSIGRIGIIGNTDMPLDNASPPDTYIIQYICNTFLPTLRARQAILLWIVYLCMIRDSNGVSQPQAEIGLATNLQKDIGKDKQTAHIFFMWLLQPPSDISTSVYTRCTSQRLHITKKNNTTMDGKRNCITSTITDNVTKEGEEKKQNELEGEEEANATTTNISSTRSLSCKRHEKMPAIEDVELFDRDRGSCSSKKSKSKSISKGKKNNRSQDDCDYTGYNEGDPRRTNMIPPWQPDAVRGGHRSQVAATATAASSAAMMEFQYQQHLLHLHQQQQMHMQMQAYYAQPHFAANSSSSSYEAPPWPGGAAPPLPPPHHQHPSHAFYLYGGDSFPPNSDPPPPYGPNNSNSYEDGEDDDEYAALLKDAAAGNTTSGYGATATRRNTEHRDSSSSGGASTCNATMTGILRKNAKVKSVPQPPPLPRTSRKLNRHSLTSVDQLDLSSSSKNSKSKHRRASSDYGYGNSHNGKDDVNGYRTTTSQSQHQQQLHPLLRRPSSSHEKPPMAMSSRMYKPKSMNTTTSNGSGHHRRRTSSGSFSGILSNNNNKINNTAKPTHRRSLSNVSIASNTSSIMGGLASSVVSEASFMSIKSDIRKSTFYGGVDHITGRTQLHYPHENTFLNTDNPALTEGHIYQIAIPSQAYEDYHWQAERTMWQEDMDDDDDSDNGDGLGEFDLEFNGPCVHCGNSRNNNKAKNQNNNSSTPFQALPINQFALAVDPSVYQRVLDEIAQASSMPCGLFYCGHHEDVAHPNIQIAVVLVAALFLTMGIVAYVVGV